jgi:hypothetical protein
MSLTTSHCEDIWEYIKRFVSINDYYKMSRVSKSFSAEYNIKHLISNNDMKSIYKIHGSNMTTIMNIINNKVFARYSYNNNKYIHANITNSISIYSDNLFNLFLYNDKIEIINVMYSLFYSSINQKYKHLIYIIDDFKLNYHNHGNFKIDLLIFTDIMHFILNYLKNSDNFKRYSDKTTLLCKLNISLVIIIIVKMEKIKGCDDTTVTTDTTDTTVTTVTTDSTDKNRDIKALYNSIIDDKILEIINSVVEYKNYYPLYFTRYILKLLNSFIEYDI